MNTAQLQSVLVFLVFAVIGFGPVSPGCLIGMYIVFVRPPWFLELTEAVYAGKSVAVSGRSLKASSAVYTRIKAFLGLLGLFIVDILPLPVTPLIAFVIIFTRPAGFYRLVRRIYL